MKKTFGTFLMKSLLTSALVLTVVAFSNVSWSAVAERPQSTAAPKPDNSARGKMRANPGAATLQISDAAIDDSETTTSDTAAENDSESVEPIFVGNKANDFDSVLADLDAPGARDSAADARAEKIRQQREALNNQSNAQSHAISTGANACDTGLRNLRNLKKIMKPHGKTNWNLAVRKPLARHTNILCYRQKSRLTAT